MSVKPKILFVGNGKSAMNLKERINEYDVIVRFNEFKTNDYVGHRTDVHISNDKNVFVKKFLNSESKNENLCFVKFADCPYNLILRRNMKRVQEKLKNKTEIMERYNIPKYYDSDIIKELSPVPLNLQPSTGMTVLLYFIHNGFDCTIIGFDNLTKDDCDLKDIHYFEKRVATEAHDWQQEREIVKGFPLKILW